LQSSVCPPSFFLCVAVAVAVGRNHLTGQFVYNRFEDIQEIVFP
jgi:hypothetical protein